MLARAVLLLAGGRRRSGGGRRLLSSSPPPGTREDELGSIPLDFPALCVWGSNTCVGKTLVSVGLAAAARRAGAPVLYLKPAQTGFPADSDARLVGAAAGLPLAAGPHAAALDSSLPAVEGPGGGSGGALAKTLYAWAQPISPHLAVQREGRAVADRTLAAEVSAELRAFAAASAAAGGGAAAPPLAIVETAGGVMSPGPAGSLQCDTLRALRLPALLVGDGRLGGISATLSAHDSLALRGHQVPLVALMEDGQLDNSHAIRRHLRGRARVLALPMCQPPPPAAAATGGAIDASLAAWLDASAPQFDELLAAAHEAHAARLAGLRAAAGDAPRVLWWPFTQHGNVSGVTTVIDSRLGESFSVYRPAEPAAAAAAAPASEAAGHAPAGAPGPSLGLLHDSCASWWTQGVSQEAQPELVRAVSSAAARYGHVMFPENAHEPAVELARQLLAGVGAGWASRVFYTDNGSTAVEAALKMAFRKYMADNGLLEGGDGAQLEVVGLQEGYHGDTLGAMDAVAPSPFNGRLQTPWYSGRGLFLAAPTAALRRGAWHVDLRPLGGAAQAVAPGGSLQLPSAAAVFDVEGRMGPGAARAPLYAAYRSYIEEQLRLYQRGAGAGAPARRLGACILEPVLQGAGGMRLVDPLYQRALVDACRQAGIPVIYDEVFTGFWRLGAPSGAALLGAPPDVACYAKLLTGGVVPLSATLATDAVFAAFEGDSKKHALLHGHSYTAHPMGCAAGVEALGLYRDPALNPNLCTPEAPGRCALEAAGGAACAGPCGRLLPLWDGPGVAALSAHPAVAGVVPLGTVLAVQLRAADGAGYGSNAAAAVVARLRGRGVFARPLGDVVYLMATPMTERAQCDALLAKLAAALG